MDAKCKDCGKKVGKVRTDSLALQFTMDDYCTCVSSDGATMEQRKVFYAITAERDQLQVEIELVKNERDAAIVTAYNRRAALEECINCAHVCALEDNELRKFTNGLPADIARNAIKGR